MKLAAAFAVLLASPLLAAADAIPRTKTVEGKLSTAHLLATARVSNKEVPDGMRFLFLVTRKPDASGNFTLKETRDFRLAGESYQDKTHAEVGKRFEPGTAFDTAEGFFTKQPNLRRMTPPGLDLKNAYILTIAMGGTKLARGTAGEITIDVGFDQQVEPFTFHFAVPPGPGDAPPKT